jgi:hypothetical protein
VPTYLKHKHVWQNCFYSTFGKEAAIINGEIIYCDRGNRCYMHNGQRVEEIKCFDWWKCKKLDQVINKRVNR